MPRYFVETFAGMSGPMSVEDVAAKIRTGDVVPTDKIANQKVGPWFPVSQFIDGIKKTQREQDASDAAASGESSNVLAEPLAVSAESGIDWTHTAGNVDPAPWEETPDPWQPPESTPEATGEGDERETLAEVDAYVQAEAATPSPRPGKPHSLLSLARFRSYVTHDVQQELLTLAAIVIGLEFVFTVVGLIWMGYGEADAGIIVVAVVGIVFAYFWAWLQLVLVRVVIEALSALQDIRLADVDHKRRDAETGLMTSTD